MLFSERWTFHCRAFGARAEAYTEAAHYCDVFGAVLEALGLVSEGSAFSCSGLEVG